MIQEFIRTKPTCFTFFDSNFRYRASYKHLEPWEARWSKSSSSWHRSLRKPPDRDPRHLVDFFLSKSCSSKERLNSGLRANYFCLVRQMISPQRFYWLGKPYSVSFCEWVFLLSPSSSAISSVDLAHDCHNKTYFIFERNEYLSDWKQPRGPNNF